MDQDRLNKILADHLKWLRREAGGERADLSGTNLYGADLANAVLFGADLRNAYLCDADLCGANICGADFSRADLCGVNLSGADLVGADLHIANLVEADLRGANFDLSSWPLWWGSFDLGHTDDRLTSQLVRHALEVAKANDSEYGRRVMEALKPLDKFHEYRSDVEPFCGGRR